MIPRQFFLQAHLKQAQLIDNLLSTNSDLATENTQLVKANQQLREASQAVITIYEQLQERLAEEQIATEELMTAQEELQVTLEEGEQICEQLNLQCVDYRRQLAALQVIVNQEVRQSFAVYDIETATLLISSPGFREVVAVIHGRSHIDLTGSTWQELFVGNHDREAKHAWQTNNHNTLAVAVEGSCQELSNSAGSGPSLRFWRKRSKQELASCLPL